MTALQLVRRRDGRAELPQLRDGDPLDRRRSNLKRWRSGARRTRARGCGSAAKPQSVNQSEKGTAALTKALEGEAC